MAASFDYLKGLIIEDSMHMRSLLRSLLHALGIKQIYEAVDGTGGYIELCEKRPNFVLTDLSMKPVHGIEFTKMVRTGQDSPNPYVPIVMSWKTRTKWKRRWRSSSRSITTMHWGPHRAADDGRRSARAPHRGRSARRDQNHGRDFGTA